MMPRDDSALLTALIQAVSAGDHDALAQLYDRTSPVLYPVLVKILHDPELAKEALQDCYIRVWQRAETFDPERGEPISWLIGNARYRALDCLRRSGPRDREVSDEVLAELPGSEPGPDEEAEDNERLTRLMRYLNGLSEMQRKSILLAYYKGYSHQEMAEALQAPLGTVKTWLRRGLSALRRRLDADEQDATRGSAHAGSNRKK